MALSHRYHPSKAPNEACTIGIDLSHMLPPGIGLSTVTISAFTTTAPANPTSDFTFGTISLRGRLAWCTISGGTEGSDYQIRWLLTDTVGNTWGRTGLMLCAQTS